MTKKNGKTLIRVENLKKHFPITRGILFQREVGSVKAVDGVSFNIKEGEIINLFTGKIRHISWLIEPKQITHLEIMW